MQIQARPTTSATPDRPPRPMRLADVADYLGVTRQRVSQLARRGGFPDPLEVADERLAWDRAQIHRWAETYWVGTRPWRTVDGASHEQIHGPSQHGASAELGPATEPSRR